MMSKKKRKYFKDIKIRTINFWDRFKAKEKKKKEKKKKMKSLEKSFVMQEYII